jgi:tripeptide aminopeptidase
MDSLGNVYGRLPGRGQAPPLVVSAHLDTVFPEEVDLSLRREAETISGPGIGDNSLGVAGLLGLLWSLKEASNATHGPSLPGDLWLVANVGEEGLGDLRGMRAVVARFSRQVRAYLVLEGMALGQVYHRGLGVKRYRITAHTPGGHSWVDYGKPSAVHELAALITRLTSLPLPSEPRTTLNVGVFRGGTTVNSIASRAHLDLDLRSVEAASLHETTSQVEALVKSASIPDVRFEIEVIGQRPVGEISSRHPLIQLAMRALEEQNLQPCLNVGSTDANIPLSQGIPATCLGLSRGGGAHTSGEFIYTQPLAQGLKQLLTVVTQIYQLSYP